MESSSSNAFTAKGVKVNYEACILDAAVASLKRYMSARTKTAMDHKRRRNERLGQVPYGHVLSDDGVTLVESPSEQQTLDLIAKWHREGASTRSIAAELTRRAVPTKKGGTVWCHATIAHIIAKGKLKWTTRPAS